MSSRLNQHLARRVAVSVTARFVYLPDYHPKKQRDPATMAPSTKGHSVKTLDAISELRRSAKNMVPFDTREAAEAYAKERISRKQEEAFILPSSSSSSIIIRAGPKTVGRH